MKEDRDLLFLQQAKNEELKTLGTSLPMTETEKSA